MRLARRTHIDEIIIHFPEQRDADFAKVLWKLSELPVNVNLCPDLSDLPISPRKLTVLQQTFMINIAERPFSGRYLDDAPNRLRTVSPELAAAERCGEWIGLARFTARGTAWLCEELALLEAEGKLAQADMPLLLTRVAAKHPVLVHYVTGHWMDVDTIEDLSNARNFT